MMSNSPEMQDIITFLSEQHPFGILPLSALKMASNTLEISYVPKNRQIFKSGDDNSYLYIVRTGAVDITDEQGNLAERCGEGDFFGFPSVLTEIPTRFTSKTIEDSLLYILPSETFHKLRRDYPEFDQHFVMVHSERILDTRLQSSRDFALRMGIRHLLTREPVSISAESNVQEAAQYMQQERVSALLVVENDRLIGIMTDRDLRNRIVASGAPLSSLVAQIMTPNPKTIDADEQTLQAQMIMSLHNIHHLPVMDGGKVLGLITSTDLMRLQSSSPVHIISEIGKQDNPADLALVVDRLPRLALGLVEADASAYDIGHILTQITDTVTCRLLELAEAELGDAPMPYAWLAFGSQARREQSARTDQDNGLLLAHKPSEEEAAYFSSLAKYVSDGLATCGYAYCPGEVMATKWCYSLEEWGKKFRHWIEEPEVEALMYSSIFFDMRPVYGSFDLADELHTTMLKRAQDNNLFLAHMAKNALGFQPPLGFFRQFVLQKSGEHRHTLDLKQHGVMPIIDMVRVYALAYGVLEANTSDRIKELIPTLAINTTDGANLIDALEFIGYVRLRHQGEQIGAGQSPDNFINPDNLSSFERQQLKTAFTIVRSMQNTLSQRYLTTYLG